MRCIFCKKDSSKSKSCEHIIPESLGNVEHILPPGIVCDKCNNYFSLKIEKKMLEQPYFTSLRFRQGIESKKGNYPVEKGVLLLNPLSEIELHITKDHVTQICIKNEGTAKKILSRKTGAFLIPAHDFPETDNQTIARFLGKVGMEELARRFSISDDFLQNFIDNERLDLLRNFVRFGKPNLTWPYHVRRIYNEDKRFFEDNLDFQILHEMTLLHTTHHELYLVICIFGIEYCMNMGGPELEGYENWLIENKNKSPLDREFCKKIDRSDYDQWIKKKQRSNFGHGKFT
jgi:hypothetical protein